MIITKKILFLFSFLICSLLVSAQEFYGGVLGGFNGSQVEGDLGAGYHKMGLIGGVWTQRDLTDDFYWGLELKIIQKGSRIKPTEKNGYWRYVWRLNYIELPVFVGYRFLNDISVFGGLSYGYKFLERGYNNNGEDPSILYNDIANWELAMFVGFKVDFERLVDAYWAQKFMLETRFQYSAVSIDSGHDLFLKYPSVGQFNNVISTVLYYRVDLGRFSK